MNNEEVQLPNGAMSQQFKVPEGKPIRFAGMVTNVMKRTTKNGDPMAIVTLEDGLQTLDILERIRAELGT